MDNRQVWPPPKSAKLLVLLAAVAATGCAGTSDRAEITNLFGSVRQSVESGHYKEVLVACPPGTQRTVVNSLRLQIDSWIEALPAAKRAEAELTFEALVRLHRVKDLQFAPSGTSLDSLYDDVPDISILFEELWKFAVGEPRIAPVDWPVPAGQFAIRSLANDLAVGVIQHPHSSSHGHHCEFIFRKVSGRWYFTFI